MSLEGRGPGRPLHKPKYPYISISQFYQNYKKNETTEFTRLKSKQFTSNNSVIPPPAIHRPPPKKTRLSHLVPPFSIKGASRHLSLRTYSHQGLTEQHRNEDWRSGQATREEVVHGGRTRVKIGAPTRRDNSENGLWNASQVTGSGEAHFHWSGTRVRFAQTTQCYRCGRR